LNLAFFRFLAIESAMPRKARIEFAGAVYHVLDRGDRREPIFRDDEDHERFLRTLGEATGRGVSL
jgi:REP-associated tyrosine transposase